MKSAHMLLTGASLLAFTAPAYAAGQSSDSWNLGVEGFYDQYKEPTAGVDEHARYGGITGGYTYNLDNTFYVFEGRVDYGRDDYRSGSGVTHDIPQYEGELRFRTGTVVKVGTASYMPYIGVGGRFFYDNGGGKQTNLGLFGYDRRIMQAYVPLGISAPFTLDSLTFTPTIEYDELILGKVDSKTQSILGTNLTSNQPAFSGYGIRGEFMIGEKDARSHYGWEVGPFVRYWNIRTSDLDKQTGIFVEPKNTRLQTGGTFRVLF